MTDAAVVQDDNTSYLQSNTPAALTATEFLNELRAGRISVLEYVQACADRIEQIDPILHAWKTFSREGVEERARKLDDDIAAGDQLRLMTGVPVGVKDIFNTYDLITGMGSPIIEGYTPGNDARVVSDIRMEHGIVMGKTVTAEFAVHHPGETRNPYDSDRTPGTSSSGSAVAVATQMCPLALSSQTGGSTIRPASYNGIYGYKPSFGLIPRTAMLKTTDTLDTVGFMARSLEDIRLMFEVCRVRGQNYPVSEAALNDARRQSVADRPWRVGLVTGPKSAQVSAAVRKAFDASAKALAAAGCEVFDYSLPSIFGTAHEIHSKIYQRSVAYYFKYEWDSDAALFSPVMQQMIEGGLRVTPEEYQAMLRSQVALSRTFEAESSNWDVLLDLSAADEAPVGADANGETDHCLIWTMVGAPALNLPLLKGRNGLPVGIQLIARRQDDYKLLQFAEILRNTCLG